MLRGGGNRPQNLASMGWRRRKGSWACAGMRFVNGRPAVQDGAIMVPLLCSGGSSLYRVGCSPGA